MSEPESSSTGEATDPPERPLRPSGSSGHVIFVGLATWGVAHVVAAIFATNATGSVVLQALAAELGAGRAGVAWTTHPVPTVAQRIAIGAGSGGAFAAVLLLAGVLSGAIHIAGGAFSVATLLLGAAISAAGAVRDELLLRGILMRAFAGKVPTLALLLGAGAASALAVPTFGIDAASRFAVGVAFASVWRLDRGAFMACAAHAMMRFALGPLVSGGVVDLRVKDGVFFGPSGLLSSPAAAGLAAIVATGLAVHTFRGQRLVAPTTH